MTGNTLSEQLFHGTDVPNAENLMEHGIREEALQSRDRGFYGDGFYLTEWRDNANDHATTVAANNNTEPKILGVCVSDDANVLNVEPVMDGPVPETIPDFHESFMEWVVDTLEDAAVWEIVEGTTREEILSSGKKERTPGSETFNGDKWRRDVTRFARDEGYDIVRWHPTEIVVVDVDTDEVSFCY